jgi:hypothetical protein
MPALAPHDLPEPPDVDDDGVPGITDESGHQA